MGDRRSSQTKTVALEEKGLVKKSYGEEKNSKHGRFWTLQRMVEQKGLAVWSGWPDEKKETPWVVRTKRKELEERPVEE